MLWGLKMYVVSSPHKLGACLNYAIDISRGCLVLTCSWQYSEEMHSAMLYALCGPRLTYRFVPLEC